MGKQTIRLFPPFFHSAPPCRTGRGNTPHPQPFIYTVHSYICRQYLSSTQPVTEITACTRHPTQHERESDQHKHSESHRATVAPAGTGFHHTHNTPRRHGSNTFVPAHPTYPDKNRRQYPGMHPLPRRTNTTGNTHQTRRNLLQNVTEKNRTDHRVMQAFDIHQHATAVDTPSTTVNYMSLTCRMTCQ